MGKIESYLGFAVRSGKILYGIDNVIASKKRKYVLVLCPDASENLKDKTERYAERYDIPVVSTDVPLESILKKTNCKLVALLDANMAKAVIDSVGR